MSRRKTRKIERFHQLPNCFDLEEFIPDQFKKSGLILEIGCGDGRFACELAKLHPDKTIIGVDLKPHRLGQGGLKAVNEEIGNVVFIKANAEDFAAAFPDLKALQVWITFPDPYPKNRHAKRRLNHLRFLDIYAQWLGAEGELLLKTDDPEFFIGAIENLTEKKKWDILELSSDLHLDNPKRFPLTTFEREFVGNGIPIFFLRAQKSPIMMA